MKTNTSSMWQDLLTGEILITSLLGRLIYNYPAGDEVVWIKSLFDNTVFEEPPFASKQERVITGLNFIKKWGFDNQDSINTEELQVDYTRLFIGPGEVIAPPWESAYLNDAKLIFQEETLKVRKWFKDFGLIAEKIYSEPDDHLGLELAFISHLSNLSLSALKAGDFTRFEEILQAKKKFLREHTSKWAFTWANKVEKYAYTDFYRGVALAIDGTLLEIITNLDQVIPLGNYR